jgi:hypothetical protein
MYYVSTGIAPASVKGRLPLTADEALRFVKAAEADGLKVRIRDEKGRPVSIERLKKEAGRKAKT